MSSDLAQYYERRAAEYDAVYAKPERQADLRQLEDWSAQLFAGRDVLEVAAGTGYWTRFIAQDARSVMATDYNRGPLEVASGRDYPARNVQFRQADAFALDGVDGRFDGAFVGFWWSHVRYEDLDRFLAGLCSRLEPGSLVAVVDNRYVEGSSSPVVHTDSRANTYQRRQLSDGTEHRVLKNFPSTEQLLAAADQFGSAGEVTLLDYFWTLTFTTRYGG
ncbi:MAG TPA: class I SAM-dependent methyltransferase [Mycobacteriales bacterium]|nr:class I SAM-dependent methyltransferase [Mycobacteriales bacterium]